MRMLLRATRPFERKRFVVSGTDNSRILTPTRTWNETPILMDLTVNLLIVSKEYVAAGVRSSSSSSSRSSKLIAPHQDWFYQDERTFLDESPCEARRVFRCWYWYWYWCGCKVTNYVARQYWRTRDGYQKSGWIHSQQSRQRWTSSRNQSMA